MDIRERLFELMNQLNMSPTQFAAAIGASRTTIQHIISGRNEPSLKIITSIYETFPSVDIKWLLKGEGSSAFTNQSQITDYPLFENDENRFFQSEVRNEVKNSNLDRQNNQKNIRQKTDNKRITSDSTAKINKKIKEIVVFFEDGTFEKFYPNMK